MNQPQSLPLGPIVSDPSPAPYPVRQPLGGDSVTLVPLDAARHGAALYVASHPAGDDSALWTYMSYGPFADPPAMGRWLEEQQSTQDPLFFTVLAEPGPQPAGMASFLNIAPAMRRLEIGHLWYGPAFQRTSVNTETVYLMLRAAFDAWGYRRVEWKCDVLNARSRQAALRLGFRPEGIFLKHYIVKQRNRDTAWFSIIDDEWPDVRSQLEQWLATGQPRPSLTEMTAAAQGSSFGQLRR